MNGLRGRTQAPYVLWIDYGQGEGWKPIGFDTVEAMVEWVEGGDIFGPCVLTRRLSLKVEESHPSSGDKGAEDDRAQGDEGVLVAEAVGGAVSMTWAERLERAAERGRFTREDKDASRNWRSCAVGERRHFKDHVDGSLWLKNNRLDALQEAGMEFSDSVFRDEVLDAAALYHWIETEMAAELGREL